jgi:phage gpG-like protein
MSVHIASAPGEAPAVDTGTLIGSIQMAQDSTLTAKVGTAVEYALYLELGTRKMQPRPVWREAVDDLLPTLTALLQSELSQLK